MSKELLTKLNEDLKLAGYKKRSCQSYVRAVRQLYNFWSRPLEELEEQHVREYWLHCKDELDWAGPTMRISYSGIIPQSGTFNIRSNVIGKLSVY